MNSKLRNSLSAFTASGATLAIALMVAVPAGTTPVQGVVSQDLTSQAAAFNQRVEVAPLAQAVVLSADAITRGAAAASALAFDADRDMEAPKQRASSRGTHHRRQTIVMPYFSFSPRG